MPKIIKTKEWNEITKENRTLKRKNYELEKTNVEKISEIKQLRIKLIQLKNECSKQHYNNVDNLMKKIKSILEDIR